MSEDMKKRTKEEIERDYTEKAATVGHFLVTVIPEANATVEKLKQEISNLKEELKTTQEKTQ